MSDEHTSQTTLPDYHSPVPQDSRYIPFTQQSNCCVPTCIQMVMYRNEIPLRSAEEIGYHLGLVVPPDRMRLFYSARTAAETPSSAGYGIQSHLPEYEPNAAFARLKIPLHFAIDPIKDISSPSELLEKLRVYERDDIDILFAFNLGTLLNDPSLAEAHHACVFDRLEGERVRHIDPSFYGPKWQTFDVEQLFNAMKKHVSPEYGGIWLLTKN